MGMTANKSSKAADIDYSKQSTSARALREWIGERSAEAVAPLFGVVPNTVRNWLDGTTRSLPGSKAVLVATITGIPVAILRADRNRLKKSRQRRARKPLRAAHKAQKVVSPNADRRHMSTRVSRGRP